MVALCDVLGRAGYNLKDYAGHSFRIGAATTAAACGIPVETIKTLGCWKREAYHPFISLPREHLADISKALVFSKSLEYPAPVEGSRVQKA